MMKPVKKQLHNFLPAVCIFFIAAACNHQNVSKGTLIDPLKNELLKMETDKGNKDKRVSVIGYPSFNSDIKAGMNDDPVINIYSEPNGNRRMLASFPIPFGKNANSVHVPKEFTNTDIVVYDNDGNPHKYDEKLQFSFTLDMQLDQPRLEQFLLDEKGLPETDSTVMAYPTYLKDIRVDKAQ